MWAGAVVFGATALALSRLERSRQEATETNSEREEARIVPMASDGNCLFRSLAYPSKNYAAVREHVSEHIRSNWERYQDFVPKESRGEFYRGISESGVWGDELTLQAFAELAEVPVVVYDRTTMERIARYGPATLNLEHGLTPRYVVYDGAHYEALDFD